MSNKKFDCLAVKIESRLQCTALLITLSFLGTGIIDNSVSVAGL